MISSRSISSVIFKLSVDPFLIRTHSTNYSHHVKEVSFPVPWGKIAGKWWGSSDIKPIICFHGLQDNCGTFDRLIPLLLGEREKEISFLAFDYPGHGFSSPIPNGMFYDFFFFNTIYKRIQEHFRFKTMSIMGHSLGSVTAMSYILSYPEKVNFVISIDGLKMPHEPVTSKILRDNLEKFMKYDKQMSDGEPRSFSLEELKEKITGPHGSSVDPDFAEFLMARGISKSEKNPGMYYFHRDPKLKMRLMMHWNHQQVVKDCASLNNPMLIFKGTESTYFDSKGKFHEIVETLKRNNKHFEFYYVEGKHHFHLNEPEKISPIINNFLAKYHELEKINVQDRLKFDIDDVDTTANQRVRA